MASKSHEIFTDHARTRKAQRGIPPLIIDWLQEYGSRHHDGRGGEVVYFDKSSRRQLEKDIGDRILGRLSDFLDAYVVVSTDNVIITAGWHYKRLQRQ